LEFCPSCGTRLIYKSKSKAGLYCTKCGYKSNFSTEKNLKKKLITENPSYSSIAILDRKTLNLRTLPIVNACCQKCNGTKAETWSLAMGSEDVSQATFFRCVSCGYTIREID
jgi:DNA-directed RNA polymerase subunit M/transcription elongation factor TFIIS